MQPITTTYLEMTSRAQLRPGRCDDPRFRVAEATVRQWQVNRFLYEWIGKPWGWRDKLSWSEARWQEYVESESLRTLIACYEGSLAGYVELQHADAEVEIAYFGLAPAFFGRGLGGALLTDAIEHAWQMDPQRIWVHTCTLDHPAALQNYQARGMSIYKREIT